MFISNMFISNMFQAQHFISTITALSAWIGSLETWPTETTCISVLNLTTTSDCGFSRPLLNTQTVCFLITQHPISTALIVSSLVLSPSSCTVQNEILHWLIMFFRKERKYGMPVWSQVTFSYPCYFIKMWSLAWNQINLSEVHLYVQLFFCECVKTNVLSDRHFVSLCKTSLPIPTALICFHPLRGPPTPSEPDT